MRHLKNKIIAKGMTALLFFTVPTLAGNALSIVRKSLNNLEVQIQNADAIGGLQFSLHSSSDVILSDPQRGDRVLASSWIVDFYKPNDTTINFLIMSAQQQSLASGSGSLVKFSYERAGAAEESSITMTNVLVVNPKDDSVSITVEGLHWSNRPAVADANTDNHLFSLGQNYPNPFNPTTHIAYQLNQAARVRLSIFDASGHEVARLVDQYEGVGEFNVIWNSKESNGRVVPSGMYFARLTVGNESTTRKLILLK